MPSHQIVTAASHAMNGMAIDHCSLNRRVALGVKSGGIDNTDAWVMLEFAEGRATLAEVRHCGPLADPDSELGADIVVIAEQSVWTDIGAGGVAAAIEAADTHKIVVGGKLPYFIRHVRSSVDLLVAFGKALARHS